jgi:hypothetical protein
MKVNEYGMKLIMSSDILVDLDLLVTEVETWFRMFLDWYIISMIQGEIVKNSNIPACPPRAIRSIKHQGKARL